MRGDFSQSGVLEFNDHSQVTQFIEEPKSINSRKWVSSGLYFIIPSILINKIEADFDFANDVIPQLL